MTMQPVGFADDDYVITVATVEDVAELHGLQAANQISRGGALSVEFSVRWFERAVEDMPIVIARRGGRMVGFLVSSSRDATRDVALPSAKFRAYPADADSYNSGPLCIEASERGRGLVEKLFATQRSLLPDREGVAFIRSDNTASRAAHAKHGFREVAEFVYADVQYVVVAYRAPGDRIQP